jgi:hypothetical protein
MKDQLYLLKPDFMDQGTGPFFCPGCAQVEGMLSFYPVLREKIEVHYIDFQRPRQEIISLIGEENQGAPKLILGENNRVIPEGVNIATANSRTFIGGGSEICKYLASAYGVGTPH